MEAVRTIQEILEQANREVKPISFLRQSKAPLPPIETPDLPIKWVKRIFIRLDSIYGHLWSSRHATAENWAVAEAEWARGLRGLTPEQINYAIEQCWNYYPMPPSGKQFRDLAKELRPHQESPQQLSEPCSQEKAQEYIQNIRRMLGIRPKSPESEFTDRQLKALQEKAQEHRKLYDREENTALAIG